MMIPGAATEAAQAAAGHRGGRPADAAFVIARLEEAGETLLSLPATGWSTRLRTSSLDIVRSALENYGWSESRVRPPVPSSARITQMDEAYAWIRAIPVENYVLRRIVGARSLINPVTGRYVFPWRRLGAALGADHKAVQRWHGQGIAMIVAALARPDAGCFADASGAQSGGRQAAFPVRPAFG
ncbi:MAG: hypothetical protein JSR21_12015 [Proteobacteria bacterium]|nr:hypothetical protein [Pseudomonadota bacterium]